MYSVADSRAHALNSESCGTFVRNSIRQLLIVHGSASGPTQRDCLGLTALSALYDMCTQSPWDSHPPGFVFPFTRNSPCCPPARPMANSSHRNLLIPTTHRYCYKAVFKTSRLTVPTHSFQERTGQQTTMPHRMVKPRCISSLSACGCLTYDIPFSHVTSKRRTRRLRCASRST